MIKFGKRKTSGARLNFVLEGEQPARGRRLRQVVLHEN